MGVHIVSTDELTGIQALERKAPTKSMLPGHVERREFEYERHGTLLAIVNFDVATGEVTEAVLGLTRTEQDFTAHMARTLARALEDSYPGANIALEARQELMRASDAPLLG